MSKKIRHFCLQVIAGILSLWLITQFISGVKLTGDFKMLLLIGGIWGLLNFFIKPVLHKLTLPLRIITLGLSGIVINMAMVWVLDVLFPELIIKGIQPLFWAAVIFWLANWIVIKIFS